MYQVNFTTIDKNLNPNSFHDYTVDVLDPNTQEVVAVINIAGSTAFTSGDFLVMATKLVLDKMNEEEK
jgi:hypothetical protein